MSVGEFSNKLLNAVAIGIVVGLIPNAILGEVFKALQPVHPIFSTFLALVGAAQSSIPVIIGCLIGVQFMFNAIEIASLGATLLISSGVVNFITVDGLPAMQLRGIGDLVNIILVSIIATILIKLLQGRLGSLSMILVPLIVVTSVGIFGYMILPYISQISLFIGNVIQRFTTLQPLLMSILLSVSFAIIIISPISTVAIAIAVGLSGLASGAANIGIATCCMTLLVGSIRAKNKLGVTVAIFLGSMKLFIPNWLKYPIINVPIILNGIVGGIVAYFFNIQGTPQSAGFGFSGMVGPINAYQFMTQAPLMRLLIILVSYFVIISISAIIIDFLLTKTLKLYQHHVFEFNS
ncbi:PTS transporter subunit IIC [Streptococcus sp. CSL7591-lung]|uniref:PTS transporter subunit IIC n=2 Tax=Streptococcus pacificus TaxID=2740577 RepID=A0ABS0ZJN5_9STRE|nr:PTS transporter subunit IIC [Streptococcus pacificus]